MARQKAAACKEADEANDQILQFTAEPNKGHAIAIDLFVDEINGERGEVCGVDSAVMATRIAFAAVKSAAEKRIVKIEEI